MSEMCPVSPLSLQKARCMTNKMGRFRKLAGRRPLDEALLKPLKGITEIRSKNWRTFFSVAHGRKVAVAVSPPTTCPNGRFRV